MFRNRKHLAQLSVNENEFSTYRIHQKTESTSELNSPIQFSHDDRPKQKLRKHSNMLPAAQQSSPYIVLPQIEEKFLTPRSHKINLMPGLAFEDLFKNPIYYEKGGLSPKGSEQIMKKIKMRHKKVEFKDFVDVVDESNRQTVIETQPNQLVLETPQVPKKRSRFQHLSHQIQLTEME